MRVIQMGVGGFGAHWANILAKYKGVDVVGMVDISKTAHAAACALHGYDEEICFASLSEALATVEADMVLCVTPPDLHREHVVEAVEAGLDVLVEKPLAGSMADCLAILDASERTGKTVVVSQNYRYKPEMRTLAELVHSGAIGEVGQIWLDFYKGWYFDTTDFRRFMPSPIIVDMSIHHFDLLRYITGQEMVTVAGRSWNPSWSENTGDTSVTVQMELDNKARFTYNASWCAQGDFADWNGNWLIEGTKGSVSYGKGEIMLRRAMERYQTAEAEPVPIKNPDANSQEAILKSFITAIESGKKPMTHVADNLRSIAAVFAALEATQTERKVEVLPPEVADLLS